MTLVLGALPEAGVAALAVIVAAGLPVIWGRRNIGRRNGQGTVVQMLESVLMKLGEHEAHFQHMDSELKKHDARDVAGFTALGVDVEKLTQQET